jgi:cation diffusion facilitator family transporter
MGCVRADGHGRRPALARSKLEFAARHFPKRTTWQRRIRSRRCLYALGANVAIGVAKLAAAIATGSSAMLAEAIHSFADCGNQALLLLGMKLAKRPPSPSYPLGHGRAIYFWSFIVALVLFSLGGVFSIYEGAHKLSSPEPLSYPWVAVGILVFGIAAETVSLRACLAEMRKVRGERACGAGSAIRARASSSSSSAKTSPRRSVSRSR